jgi:hypothetical protein
MKCCEYGNWKPDELMEILVTKNCTYEANLVKNVVNEL